MRLLSRERITLFLPPVILPVSAKQFRSAKRGQFPWEHSPSRFGATSAACKLHSLVNHLHLAKLAARPITTSMPQIFQPLPVKRDSYFFPCRRMSAVRHWTISSFHLHPFPNQVSLAYSPREVCSSACAASAVQETCR